MNSPQDIVGIVKELQKLREMTGLRNDFRYSSSLLRNFPAIAQALLIAVEALEAFTNEQHEEKSGHVLKILPTRTAIKAMKTLRKIRSLTPSSPQ